MDKTSLIFVYGTLMRGGCRAVHLAGQRFVGEGVTEPRYRMFNCGSYPGIVETTGGCCITGEIWEVDAACLRTLDRAEGVAEGLYARRLIRLRPPYADLPVEAYFYLPSTAGMNDCGTRWVK